MAAVFADCHRHWQNNKVVVTLLLVRYTQGSRKAMKKKRELLTFMTISQLCFFWTFFTCYRLPVQTRDVAVVVHCLRQNKKLCIRNWGFSFFIGLAVTFLRHTYVAGTRTSDYGTGTRTVRTYVSVCVAWLCAQKHRKTRMTSLMLRRNWHVFYGLAGLSASLITV